MYGFDSNAISVGAGTHIDITDKNNFKKPVVCRRLDWLKHELVVPLHNKVLPALKVK